MTQNEQVLQYLQEKGEITTFTAFTDLGITRLSARVYDLWKDGHNIKGERINYKAKDGKAKHYDKYTLGDRDGNV